MNYQKEGCCPHRPIISLHLEPPLPSPHTQPALTWRLDQLCGVLVALLFLDQLRQQCCCWRMKAEKWRME